MNRFRTVLFDLDGTLVDQFAAIHLTHSETRQHFGLSAPTPQEVRRAVGGGLDNTIERIWGPSFADMVPEAMRVYRELWPKNMFFEVTLLPGAKDLLSALKSRGVQSAVFTNKHGPSAREILQYLGVSDLLAGVFGALDTEWLKPQVEFTQYVLEKLQGEIATSCMIGDSPYDIETGKNAGIKTFCVATGTHSAEELKEAKADAVYSNLHDLGQGELGIQTGLTTNAH